MLECLFDTSFELVQFVQPFEMTCRNKKRPGINTDFTHLHMKLGFLDRIECLYIYKKKKNGIP